VKTAEDFAGELAGTLTGDVEAILRRVAATAIMPHFRGLATGDFHDKTPGEVVTIADRNAEAMLEEQLGALLPESRVVGEEACAGDPALLTGLDRGLVWVVDPLDGTAHFAAGREPFGTMIALAADGETLMSWIYNPIRDAMFTAALGQGAYVAEADGRSRRLQVKEPDGLPIAGLATQFMSRELREATLARAANAFVLQPIPRCAAEHYPRLCRNENHVALFQRTLPWDHAAGALLFSEAGGYVARWDGSPFRYHDQGLGILAATNRQLWDRAAEILFAGGALQAGGREMWPASDTAWLQSRIRSFRSELDLRREPE
jgi:fructose-1,6-bisphosphatase/inositol monophosphatase family enzyme